MLKFIKILFFFVLSFNYLFCQETDSLVFFDEIIFSSESEKAAFLNFLNNKKISNLILIALNDSSPEQNLEKIENQYQLLLNKFNKINILNYPEKKQIKLIYNTIHDELLKKYEIKAFYTDIFENGNFNCVSASILYAQILNYFNIPYTIKVSPTHVYLIAYPDKKPILIETTNPTVGYYTFNQSFKAKYIEYLKNSKTISEEEFYSKQTDDLFNEYYFKEKDIEFTNLIGIQYYNDAIFKMEKQQFFEAFNQLEKAYILYPAEEMGYILMINGSAAFEKLEYTDINKAKLLYKLARYEKYGINKNDVIGEFAKITQNVLNYEGNLKLYDSIYHVLSQKLLNKDISSEISFIYYYEKTRFLASQSEYIEMLPFVEKAYDLKPNNAQVQTLLVYAISNQLANLSDIEAVLNYINYYSAKFKNLDENDQFLQIKLEVYLEMARNMFDQRNISMATDYILKFEDSYRSNINFDALFEYKIVSAYSAGAIYYYRKGNYPKAKEILTKGLIYAPNNYELKSRLDALQ